MSESDRIEEAEAADRAADSADARPSGPDAARALQPGDEVDDRYRIVERLGAGGMGVVYRARQLELDRDIVLKIIARDRLDDEVAVQRFEREARSLSRIDHPNIVEVYDYGRDGGVHFIVMEYVDGSRLDALVREHRGLPFGLFAPIAIQILYGVAEAHRIGLVHRDLKPSNIVLADRRGRGWIPKVLDFGLAKLVSGDEDVTTDGNLVGSFGYLSPEQIGGGDVDQRADVYALGVLFYFALAARKPFEGKNASILYDQIHTNPPPLRNHVSEPDRLPARLYQLIARCLAKQPEARPESADEMLERMVELTPPDQLRDVPVPLSSEGSSEDLHEAPTQPTSREIVGPSFDTQDERPPPQAEDFTRQSDSPDNPPAEPQPAGPAAHLRRPGFWVGVLLAATGGVVAVYVFGDRLSELIGADLPLTDGSENALPVRAENPPGADAARRIRSLVAQGKLRSASELLDDLDAESSADVARLEQLLRAGRQARQTAAKTGARRHRRARQVVARPDGPPAPVEPADEPPSAGSPARGGTSDETTDGAPSSGSRPPGEARSEPPAPAASGGGDTKGGARPPEEAATSDGPTRPDEPNRNPGGRAPRTESAESGTSEDDVPLLPSSDQTGSSRDDSSSDKLLPVK
ncbi:MAG: protein kinase [Bradymonadaceae bacterium]